MRELGFAANQISVYAARLTESERRVHFQDLVGADGDTILQKACLSAGKGEDPRVVASLIQSAMMNGIGEGVGVYIFDLALETRLRKLGPDDGETERVRTSLRSLRRALQPKEESMA